MALWTVRHPEGVCDGREPGILQTEGPRGVAGVSSGLLRFSARRIHQQLARE